MKNKWVLLFLSLIIIACNSNKSQLDKAEKLISGARYDTALEMINNVIKENPGSERAHYLYVLCLLNSGTGVDLNKVRHNIEKNKILIGSIYYKAFAFDCATAGFAYAEAGEPILAKRCIEFALLIDPGKQEKIKAELLKKAKTRLIALKDMSKAKVFLSIGKEIVDPDGKKALIGKEDISELYYTVLQDDNIKNAKEEFSQLIINKLMASENLEHKKYLIAYFEQKLREADKIEEKIAFLKILINSLGIDYRSELAALYVELGNGSFGKKMFKYFALAIALDKKTKQDAAKKYAGIGVAAIGSSPAKAMYYLDRARQYNADYNNEYFLACESYGKLLIRQANIASSDKKRIKKYQEAAKYLPWDTVFQASIDYYTKIYGSPKKFNLTGDWQKVFAIKKDGKFRYLSTAPFRLKTERILVKYRQAVYSVYGGRFMNVSMSGFTDVFIKKTKNKGIIYVWIIA